MPAMPAAAAWRLSRELPPTPPSRAAARNHNPPRPVTHRVHHTHHRTTPTLQRLAPPRTTPVAGSRLARSSLPEPSPGTIVATGAISRHRTTRRAAAAVDSAICALHPRRAPVATCYCLQPSNSSAAMRSSPSSGDTSRGRPRPSRSHRDQQNFVQL
ncbi:hypothetical protein L1887_63480 [Cichorium endivia]|nr:hypothetical protein L1887_63480 [Cichorium endivia]